MEKKSEIHVILADHEFEILREDVGDYGARLNIAAKKEYFPEVERQNWVNKDRARYILQTLPCDTMPKKMRIATIHYVMYWLNMIPKKDQ